MKNPAKMATLAAVAALAGGLTRCALHDEADESAQTQGALKVNKQQRGGAGTVPPPAVTRSGPNVDVAPSYEPREERFHSRPEGEWQGMLVEVGSPATCDGTIPCGLALACKEGACLPCVADHDCERGELCVLDHCLLRENITCRRTADCEGGVEEGQCILSGYSADPRSNSDLRSACLRYEGPGLAGPEDFEAEMAELASDPELQGPADGPQLALRARLRELVAKQPEGKY